MGILDMLTQAAGGGVAPDDFMHRLLGSSPLGAAGQGAAAIGQAAAAGTPGVPQPDQGAPAPGQGAPAAPPVPSVPAVATPPDLSALYSKLLQSDRQRRSFDQGSTLIAAGLANPDNRGALINMAAHAQDQEGTAGQQLQTLLSLQANSQKYANLKNLQVMAPAVAAKYGIPIEAVATLIASDPTKYAEMVSKLNTDPATTTAQSADGRTITISKATGAEIGSAGPQKVELHPNAAGQQQGFVNGVVAGAPVGPTKSDDDARKPPDKLVMLRQLNDDPTQFGVKPADPDNPNDMARFHADMQNQRDQIMRGGGVTINNTAEHAEQQGLGTGRAKIRVAAMEAGAPAQQNNNTLDELSDALKAAGPNLTTGPLSEGALKLKQTLQDGFGVKFAGTDAAEVANKLQFTLASQATKMMSSRGGTQAEFLRAMANTPGIMLSPEGSTAMISVLKQNNQAQIDLARAAQDPNNKDNWQDVQTQYFKDHPLISPFTGKPVDQSDLKKIGTMQPAAAPQAFTDILKKDPTQDAIYHYDRRFGVGAAEKALGRNF